MSTVICIPLLPTIPWPSKGIITLVSPYAVKMKATKLLEAEGR